MLYSIEDKTLTALGDTLRKKTPDFIYVDAPINYPEEIIMDTRELEIAQRSSGYDYYLLPIDLKQLFGNRYEMADKYYAEVDYEQVNEGYDYPLHDFGLSWLKGENVTDAIYTTTTWFYSGTTQPLVGTKSTKFLHIMSNYFPYLFIRCKWGVSDDLPDIYCRIKVKLWPADTASSTLIEMSPKQQYTPLEMAEVIQNDFIYKEPWIISTGNDMFKGEPGAKLVKLLGDKIRTKNLVNIMNMFSSYPLNEVPFELNFSSTNTDTVARQVFVYSKITIPPKFNNFILGECDGIFANMYYLREFPEGYFDNWDFSMFHSRAKVKNRMLSSCYSLRKVPQTFLDNMWISYNTININVIHYYELFSNCSALDEIIDLNIAENDEAPEMTNSSSLYMLIANCYRLKDFTFKKNPDGSPKRAKWNNLTLDFGSVGVTASTNRVLDYNSGITKDKEVKDDATYQALKNDPDWFSANVNYSRYNHDSAVNTINSLPDCSTFGTNIIRFKGACGAKTDGGAINTMTEEEIAVATAKGWTVSFV